MTTEKLNKTVYIRQIPINGHVGINSDIEYSFERFVGSYRAKIRDIRDVNYIEHIKIK